MSDEDQKPAFESKATFFRIENTIMRKMKLVQSLLEFEKIESQNHHHQ